MTCNQSRWTDGKSHRCGKPVSGQRNQWRGRLWGKNPVRLEWMCDEHCAEKDAECEYARACMLAGEERRAAKKAAEIEEALHQKRVRAIVKNMFERADLSI
jgi:hypothetical protein